ncbi:MAG: ATP-dependent DNA helicase RecG [Solirubrobacterales bacterium]
MALRSSPTPSQARRSIRELPGCGPQRADAAAELGLGTLADLARYLPREYRDLPLRRLGELRPGDRATVVVTVEAVSAVRTSRRGMAIVEARVADDSGASPARWFGQRWVAGRLSAGDRLLLTGRRDDRGLTVEAFEPVRGDPGARVRAPLGMAAETDPPAGLHTQGPVADYPASEALANRQLREWAWRACGVARHLPDAVGPRLRSRLGLPSVADALHATHTPQTVAEAEDARRALAFEELFCHQAALLTRRRDRQQQAQAAPTDPPGPLVDQWLASLPFAPTDAQRTAFAAVDADLAEPRPMQRLLMGEVGSGKTVVALYAMLRAVEGGRQAALMAPTETLAEQHFATLGRLLGAVLPAALLTGSTPKARRREQLGHLANGQLQLVVGTHALLEGDVEFRALGVTVVDEQHRFGVRQRAALDAKGPDALVPHALHMTATPIPRTLSLTAYGDLDVTELRELPSGRRPIATRTATPGDRDGVAATVRAELQAGRQAYWVCPLIDTSEQLQAAAATETAEALAAGPFAAHRVGCLHGRMSSRDKQDVMAAFGAGKIDLLVATTVVEVGVDVPNATVMVVDGAERYGLSQLHQLRGRVGRGADASQCLLIADAQTETARRRLEAIVAESDGFRLAEIDLVLRGEGEILGTRQHGLPSYSAARLPEDGEILARARAALVELLDEHGGLDAEPLALLADAVQARFPSEPESRLAA